MILDDESGKLIGHVMPYIGLSNRPHECDID